MTVWILREGEEEEEEEEEVVVEEGGWVCFAEEEEEEEEGGWVVDSRIRRPSWTPTACQVVEWIRRSMPGWVGGEIEENNAV